MHVICGGGYMQVMAEHSSIKIVITISRAPWRTAAPKHNDGREEEGNCMRRIGEECTGRSMEGEYVRLGNRKQKTGKTESAVIDRTHMDAVIAH